VEDDGIPPLFCSTRPLLVLRQPHPITARTMVTENKTTN